MVLSPVDVNVCWHPGRGALNWDVKRMVSGAVCPFRDFSCTGREMTDLHEALARVPYFQELDEAAIRLLAERADVRECQPDSVVLSQGDPGAVLGVVVSGQLRVVRTSLEGREQVLRILVRDAASTMLPRSTAVTARLQ